MEHLIARGCTAVLVLLTLAGCVGTGYRESGALGIGGYKQQQLKDDIWRVSFAGNGFTTQESAQTFWLYRAAELALEKGYDGFEILSDMRFVRHEAPHPFDTEGAILKTGAAPLFIPMPSSGPPHPRVEGDIRLLKRPFKPSPPRVFDAAQLKGTLEPHVKGKSCGTVMSGSNNVCPHAHDYLSPVGRT